MRLIRWKKRKNHNALEARRNTVVTNGDESRRLGMKLSDLLPGRGSLIVLGFFILFHFQYNKPSSDNDYSFFDEIPSMESNMAMIQSVTTNMLSSTNTEFVTTTGPELLNNKSKADVAPSTIPPQTSPPQFSESQPEERPAQSVNSWRRETLSTPATIQKEAKKKQAKKQSTSPPPRRQNEHKQVVTVVAQLNGELGNQMHKIANAVCVQRHIERKLHLKTELLLRAQDNPKWEHSMRWMKEAFPNTRPLDFRAGNSLLFDQVRQIQQTWIQQLVDTKQVQLKGIGNPKILNRMESSGWQPTMEVLRLLNQTWYMDRPNAPGYSTQFSIPHVYSDTFTSRYCFEKMLPEIRDFFQIDEYKVCKQKPQPDESVLHLRNFLVEMPDYGRELGFEELSPEKTATEIFKNYKPGDKVAIVSRYPDNTDKYIKALKDIRGIEARYIKGQTGNQDFCFLLKSQQEIIGQRISTFATWAGLLGRPKKLRLYSVDSKFTRARKKSFYNATWNHPELKQMIVYENYKA